MIYTDPPTCIILYLPVYTYSVYLYQYRYHTCIYTLYVPVYHCSLSVHTATGDSKFSVEVWGVLPRLVTTHRPSHTLSVLVPVVPYLVSLYPSPLGVSLTSQCRFMGQSTWYPVSQLHWFILLIISVWTGNIHPSSGVSFVLRHWSAISRLRLTRPALNWVNSIRLYSTCALSAPSYQEYRCRRESEYQSERAVITVVCLNMWFTASIWVDIFRGWLGSRKSTFTLAPGYHR